MRVTVKLVGVWFGFGSTAVAGAIFHHQLWGEDARSLLSARDVPAEPACEGGCHWKRGKSSEGSEPAVTLFNNRTQRQDVFVVGRRVAHDREWEFLGEDGSRTKVSHVLDIEGVTIHLAPKTPARIGSSSIQLSRCRVLAGRPWREAGPQWPAAPEAPSRAADDNEVLFNHTTWNLIRFQTGAGRGGTGVEHNWLVGVQQGRGAAAGPPCQGDACRHRFVGEGRKPCIDWERGRLRPQGTGRGTAPSDWEECDEDGGHATVAATDVNGTCELSFTIN